MILCVNNPLTSDKIALNSVNMKDNILFLIDELGGQSQVARNLGVTRQCVNKWISQGHLPSDYTTRLKLEAIIKDRGLLLPEEKLLTRIVWDEPDAR